MIKRIIYASSLDELINYFNFEVLTISGNGKPGSYWANEIKFCKEELHNSGKVPDMVHITQLFGLREKATDLLIKEKDISQKWDLSDNKAISNSKSNISQLITLNRQRSLTNESINNSSANTRQQHNPHLMPAEYIFCSTKTIQEEIVKANSLDELINYFQNVVPGFPLKNRFCSKWAKEISLYRDGTMTDPNSMTRELGLRAKVIELKKQEQKESYIKTSFQI